MPGLVVRSPGWSVSTLLHCRPITVLLEGNAVSIGLTSAQNTGDRAAVKGNQGKLTHEWVEGCSGTIKYLTGEYVAGCVYDRLEWLLLWPTSRLFGLICSAHASRCQGWWFDPQAGRFQHCYIMLCYAMLCCMLCSAGSRHGVSSHVNKTFYFVVICGVLWWSMDYFGMS